MDESIIDSLRTIGTFDIIQQARDTEPLIDESEPSMMGEIDNDEEIFVFDSEEKEELDPKNLYSFLPVKKVYSEKQLLRQEEEQQSIYMPKDIVKTVPCSSTRLPENLKLYTYDLGNINSFPRPSLAKTDLLGELICCL